MRMAASATQLIGSLQEYRLENEPFSAYIERVNLFFIANGVEADKKVAVFLTVVGSKTYSLLRNLVAPALPQDKSFTDLVAVLKQHFEPKPLVIAERFHFHKRNQAVSESIADYMAELRKLTTHCGFGDHLEEALRDQLVCGIRDVDTQRKLLAVSDLTLKKALEIARGTEAAMKNSKSLKVGEPRVNAVTKVCYRCGKGPHDEKVCRYRNTTCNSCGKQGHLAQVCRSKKQAAKAQPSQSSRSHPRQNAKPKQAKYVAAETVPASEEDSMETEYLPLHHVGGGHTPPIKVPIDVNGVSHLFELDTGATVTIMSKGECQKLFPKGTLMKKSSLLLKTYSGECLPVLGEMKVDVQYGQQKYKLNLVVVDGNGPSLLGRDWLNHIKFDWREIKAITQHDLGSLECVLDKYSEIFSDEVGTIKTHSAKLCVNSNASPKFFKPRTVPYSMKGAIEEELDRWEREGIVEKVTHSEWATPLVAVPKSGGRVRLCGDFKVTLNPVLKIDQYPLPKAEDLFATLAGGKRFTKLDLSEAYLQLKLDPDSRQYCVINTHKGLYKFLRLPFGLASAPALFQRVMDTILQGIPATMCYIDDILVTGSSDEEHLQTLEVVLKRLQEYGIRMKRSKCFFMKDSVEYLGHVVDAEGIHATPGKVAAIEKAPHPENVAQLRSFLGLLNYYRKFLPNLATILQPLNELLQKNKKWVWSSKCEEAMNVAKQLLLSSKLLTHYDESLPLKLATDASPYGLGAVISHVLSNGEERPIAFASRSLSKTEQNYSQIDKEALGLIYGVRKFHTYLYGRKFTLVTDHKPLTSILGPKKGVSAVAAARLQRWALLLSAYCYDLEFRSTLEHGNADALSRLPLPDGNVEHTSETQLFYLQQLETLPITSQEIKRGTERDPVLSKVHSYVMRGWPNQVPQALRPYHSKISELSVEEGCLMWGGRVIIPQSLQNRILAELHKEHLGMTRMKTLARSHVWWSGISKDLEMMAKSCKACLAVKQAPATAPMYPWEWPRSPWERLHIDFAGPFMDRSFLIVVDAHSKWAEVIEMRQTTTAETIIALRGLFATHGIPHQIVSDNGPQFVSADFEEFTRTNGIKHSRSSPYHPATNGEAERFVRTFKEALKTGKGSGLTVKHQLQNFLLTYRTTPHRTTGVAPCDLLMGRRLRTRWDLLRPELSTTVEGNQYRQKQGHDLSRSVRSFQVGQEVMARNFRAGESWIPGIVVQKLGPVTYLVDVSEGRFWKRHVDHIKEYQRTDTENEFQPTSAPELEFAASSSEDDVQPEVTPNIVDRDVPPTDELTSSQVDTQASQEAEVIIPADNSSSRSMSQDASGVSKKSYPRRSRKRPERYSPTF